jgi:putative ABC transport system permease protein
MGIQFRAGRDFLTSDVDSGARVVIVNATFAERNFPGKPAVGQRISLNGPAGPWREIVGVVGDGKYVTLDETPMRLVYIPLAQGHVNGMTLVVRSEGDPATIATAVGRAVQSLEPALPVASTRAMRDVLATTLYAARAGAWLLALFGALALLLAAVGLYGVMSYAVARRTREIGLRMALGANPGTVLKQVLREGMTLVIVGVVAGLSIALGATRLLAGFLNDVSRTDPATFGTVSAMLVTVAAVACLVPAWRATRVDPIAALREE